VVRDADGAGVDVLAFLVEHDAEVFVLGLLGILGEVGRGAVVIDIAHGHQVFGFGGLVEDRSTLAPAADSATFSLS